MRQYRKSHIKMNRPPAVKKAALIFISGLLIFAFILGQLLGAVEKTRASEVVNYTTNAKQQLKEEGGNLVRSIAETDDALNAYIAGQIKEDQFYNSAEVYKFDLVIMIDAVREIKPESKQLQRAQNNLLNAMLIELSNAKLLFDFIEDKDAAQLSDYKQNRYLTVGYLKKYNGLLK